jgi:N-acetylmuramoyl-L-alanine amidase
VDVRISGDSSLTLVEIQADRSLDASVFALDAGARRIVIDLPKVRWSLKGLTAEAGAGVGVGLVRAFEYAHSAPDSSRLVLELTAPAIVEKPPGSGQKLSLALKSVDSRTFAAAAAETAPTPPPRPTAAVRRPLIVLDPGHGGKDPGALSPDTGSQEKDVTLAIAMALRDALVATGRFDVALTREGDTFIELEDRVDIARKLGANLFMSLHADAGGRSTVRGASIYTLSTEGEKRAEATRERNDWVLAVETDTTRSEQVNDILADLVQRETKNQSARFALMLEPALSKSGWPVLPHAHRRRGFFVLLSPDVPAVLLEMGFMTNPEDVRMLTSRAQRDVLVSGIVTAVEDFFAGSATQVVER